MFEEVNKLHECAARELNMSYAKSLKNMENATQATKWKASSIMSCQDREGSICRSSSRGRIISRYVYIYIYCEDIWAYRG